jgi:RHS repeat-associated protein
MNARYYNSTNGQFTSQDTAFWNLSHLELQLSDPQSWNSYAYARNNPLIHVDMTGNMWTPWQSSGGFTNWMGNGGFLYNVYGSNVNSITGTAKNIQQNGWTKDNVMALGTDAASITAKTSVLALGSVGVGMGAGGAVSLLSPTTITTGTTACAGGGCEKASRAVQQSQKVLNGPINITANRLQHVLDGHTAGGIESAGNSIFNKSESVVGLIRQGTQQVIEKQAHGPNFQRVYDVGRNIGVDRATNQQTSWMTVITNNKGDLITAFPGKP